MNFFNALQRFSLISLLCVASLVFGSDAVRLDITERRLGPALVQFSEQTQIKIQYDRSIEDLASRSISGVYQPEEALSLLLASTGLIFEMTDEQNAVVKPGYQESMTVSAASRDLAYRETVGATATKTDTLLTEVPQSIQIVSSKLMSDQLVRRLGDALSNVSNVQQRGTFLGAYEQFAIRGFVLDNRSNYYRDGRKYSNFVAPAIEVLERVEVLKGPGSVLFGQANPGGIVNFVTQQPSREWETMISLGGGQQGREAGTLNLSGPIGNSDKLYFRLVGATEDEDRFRDFVETERRVLYASLRYEINQFLSLTMHVDDLTSDTVADSGLVAVGDRVVDQPLTTNYNEPWARYDSENTNVGYRLTALLNPSWQIRHSFNSQRLNRLRIDAQPVLVDVGNGAVFRRARQRDQDFNNDFADIQLIGDIGSGSVTHTLMFGAEYVDELNDARETENVFLPIALFNPEHMFEKPDFVPRTGVASERRVTGLYFQDQIDVGERFDLLFGLRYDRYETEILAETSPGGSKISVAEADHDSVTFRAGGVWQLDGDTSLYASYTEGFFPNLNTNALPPEFLDPEESRQYEVGAKYEGFDGRFFANAAVFDLEKSNIMRVDPATDQAFLIGVQGHQGVEFDLAGDVTPELRLTASFAFLDAEISEDVVNEGNRPQNVAEQSGGLWSSYVVRDGVLANLRFSAGLRYVGERFGDDAESFVLPSYTRFDLGLGYDLELGGGRLEFNAKLENVSDEEYFVGALGRTQITPGEPRRFLATARYRF